MIRSISPAAEPLKAEPAPGAPLPTVSRQDSTAGKSFNNEAAMRNYQDNKEPFKT
jgi:hypothetical protein